MWTLILILINFFIFFLEIAYPKLIYTFGFIPNSFLQRPWTLFTSIFLHADFSHLFFNMLALFFFGYYFESKYGKRNFLIVYFISGIFGNLAYYLWNPTSSIPGIGASGAIYGIMGALAILEPFTIVYINFVPVPLIVAAIFWLTFNLVGLFNPFSNIGYHAHLAGLLFGFYYGYKIKKEIKNYIFIEEF